MSRFRSCLRMAAVALLLSLSLLTGGCGLAAGYLISAIEDGINGGDDDENGGGTPALHPAVGVIHGLSDVAHVNDVVGRLTSTQSFAVVTAIDASAATPTLAALQVFDAVLVVGDGSFFDAVALGDVLAAYSDSGGGVVTATHARPGDVLLGAWATGSYMAIDPAGVVSGDGPIGWFADLTTHPIVAGLALPGGGTGSDRPDIITVTAGSTRVASWNTGEPLVVVRVTTVGTRVASLGFHVVSDGVDPSFVDGTSSATTVVSRALLWVMLEI